MLHLKENFPAIVSLKESHEGLSIWIELLHSIVTKNYVYYPPEKLQGDSEFRVNEIRTPTGIYSLLDPYPKPILVHHDETGEPVGRIRRAKFVENTRAGMPGVMIEAVITDPVAAQKVADQRYYTVSAGLSTDGAKCSICNQDQLTEGMCDHPRGEYVEGKLAYWKTGNIWFKEGSFVNIPGDSFARVIDAGGNLAHSEKREDTKERDTGKRLISIANNGNLNVSGNMSVRGKLYLSKEALRETDRHVILGIYEKALLLGSLPIAENSHSWNAATAIGRIKKWAGGPEKEKINWSRYRKAFFWYNESDPENFGSYKLPFVDVVNGHLIAVPKGIEAAAEKLDDVPEEQREAVQDRIALYFRKLNENPPWHNSQMNESESANKRFEEIAPSLGYSQAVFAVNLLMASDSRLTHKSFKEEVSKWRSWFNQKGWRLPKALAETS